MEVVVEQLGAVQFEVKAREHTIVTDQPRENGGFDEGMTPPELLLASLGACAAFYAAEYLRKHKLASEGTRVLVVAAKEKNPARIDHFRIEVEVPAALEEQHRAGVEDAVHHCLIHNTLLHPPGFASSSRQAPCSTSRAGLPSKVSARFSKTPARTGPLFHYRTCPPAI